MIKFSKNTIKLIFIINIFLAPAHAFLFNEITKDRHLLPKPVFENRSIEIKKTTNPIKISIPIPKDWVEKHSTNNHTNFELQFYPPKQDINTTTDLIKLQILKFQVANNKEALANAAELIKKKNKALNQTTEYIESTEYLQGGYNTIELISVSEFPGVKKHKVLSLIKLIATGESSDTSFGLISINKESFFIWDEADLNKAKEEIELYRQEFRKIKLQNWSKPEFKQAYTFEQATINLGKDKSSPKLSIYKPKTWIIEPVIEDDTRFRISIKAPNAHVLPYEFMQITINKGNYKDDYKTLEGLLYQSMKKKLQKSLPGTIFTQATRYQQDGMNSIEFRSESQSPEGVAVYSSYKILATGNYFENNLGIIVLTKVTSNLIISNPETERKNLSLFNQEFRKTKLINWPVKKERKPFEQPIFEIKILKVNDEARLSIPIPQGWEIVEDEETDSLRIFVFQPKIPSLYEVEKIKIYINRINAKDDLETAIDAVNIAQASLKESNPGIKFSEAKHYIHKTYRNTEYYSEVLIQDSVMNKNFHKQIFTGRSPVNTLGVININYGLGYPLEKESPDYQEAINRFKEAFQDIELINWPYKRPAPKFSQQIIKLDEQNSISLELPEKWKLIERLDEEQYYAFVFEPEDPERYVINSLYIYARKIKIEQGFLFLRGFTERTKKRKESEYPGIRFSKFTELTNDDGISIEYDSNWLDKGGQRAVQTKRSSIPFQVSNIGLITAEHTITFYDYYSYEIFRAEIEAIKNKLRTIKLITKP